jgi:hypothetical protein
MGTAPGLAKLVKAGFVQLDVTGVVVKIVAFQYNPETLVRRLDTVETPAGAAAGSPPRETVNFSFALDATDKLQAGDALIQQTGLLPFISTLELLLYPAANTLTVWVSGERRIVPVLITQMQILEQAFDAALNPIRAEVSVALQVLKDADFAPGSHGRALWDAHFATLQQLANSMGNATLGTLGLKGI